MCTRALLKEISGKSKIFYDSSGSPNIDENFISISHSKKLVAIILSDKNCAIDIEEISVKSKSSTKQIFKQTESKQERIDNSMVCKGVYFQITQNKKN